MRKSFTLVEILIVIGIIGILAAGLLLMINPQRQLGKAFDGKRKEDLSRMKKTFEDFYTDRSRYPRGDEVCYDSNSSSRIDAEGNTACTCKMCGQRSKGALKLYTAQLACDPESPNKDILYDYDCFDDSPQWYRMYVKLNALDAEGQSLSCQLTNGNGTCGPSSEKNYSYGVTSSNVSLEH